MIKIKVKSNNRYKTVVSFDGYNPILETIVNRYKWIYGPDNVKVINSDYKSPILSGASGGLKTKV